MTRYLAIKIGLAVIGVILFGYGVSADSIGLRWLGIGFLAASVLLRFLPKRLRTDDYPPNPPAAP